MATLTVTAAKVGFLDIDTLLEKLTLPAGEAIDAGEVMRIDTTTGKWKLAAGGAAADARASFLAVKSANTANVAITGVRKGAIDLGNALSGVDYDADLYLSNTTGKISTTAGTVSKVVGTVIPAFGHTTADKLLRVDL